MSIALHTDHCPPQHEHDFLRPLIATQRFNSHMFDGSTLPLAREPGPLRARCSNRRTSTGLLLEIEVGAVGGEEDGITGDGDLYSTPEELLGSPTRSARASMAATCWRRPLATSTAWRAGAASGCARRFSPRRTGRSRVAAAALRLRLPRLERHRPTADLRAALAYGVVKVNLDSEAQFAFTSGAAEHLRHAYDGTATRKAAYDPRGWGKAAERAMAHASAEACRLLGSAR